MLSSHIAQRMRVVQHPESGERFMIGDLEAEVLAVIWELQNATVREVLPRLGESKAYTTVMTAMSHLAEKKLLRRVREHGAYRYYPACSRDDVQKWFAENLLAESRLSQMLSVEAVVSSLIQTESDLRILSDIQKRIQSKRVLLKQTSPRAAAKGRSKN
jgi:predicted transcriptional regulator